MARTFLFNSAWKEPGLYEWLTWACCWETAPGPARAGTHQSSPCGGRPGLAGTHQNCPWGGRRPARPGRQGQQLRPPAPRCCLPPSPSPLLPENVKGYMDSVTRWIFFEGPKTRKSVFLMSAYGFHNFQLSFCEGNSKWSFCWLLLNHLLIVKFLLVTFFR